MSRFDIFRLLIICSITAERAQETRTRQHTIYIYMYVCMYTLHTLSLALMVVAEHVAQLALHRTPREKTPST